MTNHEQGSPEANKPRPQTELIDQSNPPIKQKTEAKKKVWYKDVPNLISALALLIATIAIVQTHNEHTNHELESLEQIAEQIVENQKALNELPATQADAVLSSNIQSFLIQKGNTLASRGIALLKDYNGEATPDILFVIGYQAAISGHYAESEDLYRRAIKEADSPLSQSGPRLALARLYFDEGSPIFSVEKGEKLYSEALQGMESSKDPASIYEKGFLNETWAAAEFQQGKADSGLKKLDAAATIYRSLPLWNVNRLLALQRVDQTRSKLLQTSDEGQKLAQRLAGKWVVTGQQEGPPPGVLTISIDPDSASLSGVFVEENAIRTITPRLQITGPIVVSNSHSAVFTWQGADVFQGTISGKTVLTFDDDLATISAAEQRPGQAEIKYKLARAPKPAKQ